MAEKEIPDWLYVGAEVVVVGGYWTPPIHRVARFTKTRVVLDNGEWFPLDRLERRVGGSYGHTEYLRSAKDPDVVRTRVHSAIRSRVSRLYESSRRRVHGEHYADDTLLEMQAEAVRLLTLLDKAIDKNYKENNDV